MICLCIHLKAKSFNHIYTDEDSFPQIHRYIRKTIGNEIKWDKFGDLHREKFEKQTNFAKWRLLWGLWKGLSDAKTIRFDGNRTRGGGTTLGGAMTTLCSIWWNLSHCCRVCTVIKIRCIEIQVCTNPGVKPKEIHTCQQTKSNFTCTNKSMWVTFLVWRLYLKVFILNIFHQIVDRTSNVNFGGVKFLVWRLYLKVFILNIFHQIVDRTSNCGSNSTNSQLL